MNKLFEGIGRLVSTIFCIVVFICVVMLLIYYDYQTGKIEKCERENNVYECELVAVPKEQEE